tara:strand:- start:1774 stop:2199 length:426 start_codon:yes stop_codon:yes gene_type:complete
MSHTTIELATQRVEALEKQITMLLDNKAKDNKKVNGGGKQKKNDATNSEGDDAPKKKKTSGYLQHNAAQRPALKALMESEITDANNKIDIDNAALPNDQHKPHTKLKSTDVLSRLAVNWKALDETERNLWNARAVKHNDTP